MPVAWAAEPNEAPDLSGAFSYSHGDPPYASLRLWAHNSLTPQGFVWFIGITCGLILLPLVAVIGSPVLWGILPFMLLMLGTVWWALKASWRSKQVKEYVRLWSDRIEISHLPPKGDAKEWAANPHWVKLHLHPSDGPVANYITLSGGGREVELGAFLSEEERQTLFDDLNRMIGRLNAEAQPSS